MMGGIVATGTIARTAANVRANAHGPVAGMLHALFVLGFMLVAAPLVGMIPLAALAGLLATVTWTMIERHAIATLPRTSRGDAAVLTVTLLLPVFRDLTEAIVVGVAVVLSGLAPDVAVHLAAHGVHPPAVGLAPDVAAAVAVARRALHPVVPTS